MTHWTESAVSTESASRVHLTPAEQRHCAATFAWGLGVFVLSIVALASGLVLSAPLADAIWSGVAVIDLVVVAVALAAVRAGGRLNAIAALGLSATGLAAILLVKVLL